LGECFFCRWNTLSTDYRTTEVIIYNCKRKQKKLIAITLKERVIQMKRIYKGNLSFVMLTMCLVFVSALCITKTVQSQSNAEQVEMEQYYRVQEEQLVDGVKAYLNEEGFRNSGVMLTRVVAADGMREYTITVHHDKISKMDAVKKEELRIQLSGFYFPVDNCIFYHEFLEAD